MSTHSNSEVTLNTDDYVRNGVKMKPTPKQFKVAALIIFIIDVVALIIILGLLWGMPEPSTMTIECGYMCLPCTDDQTKMCCGCRDEIMLKFMKETFEEKYPVVSNDYEQMFSTAKVKHQNGSIADYKPVAHLVGENNDMPVNVNESILPIRKWQKGKNCLLLNGVSFHRGRFRVPVSGYYHVYSGIDFNYQYKKGNNSSLLVPAKHHMLIHAIFKSNVKNFGIEEKIVCTQHPYEMSKNEMFSRYDTYVGGDFYFEAGDELYVKVENISYASSPPKNVFGLHFI